MKRIWITCERDHERQWTVAGTHKTHMPQHFLSTFRQFNYTANYFNFFIFYIFHLNAKIAVNNLCAAEKKEMSKRVRALARIISNGKWTYNTHTILVNLMSSVYISFCLLNDFFSFSRVYFVMRFALHNKTMNQNDDKELKWTSINPKMAASKKKIANVKQNKEL